MDLPSNGSPPPSTSELVAAARRGDQRAWDEIHRRYYAVMRLVLQGRIPAQLRGRFDTEDVLQSGFLQAFRQIDSFTDDTDDGFRRWLTTLMINKLHDRVRFHRRQRRDGSRDQGSIESADGKPGMPMEDSPSVLMSAAERFSAVLAAIHKLAPEDQRLIVLRVTDRLSWAEIAERMQLGEATARRRFLEAFENLVGRIE
jgi:RNA polymerase sigma factor (sigma-70 family)